MTSLQDLLDDGSLISMDASMRFSDTIGPGTAYAEGFGLRLSEQSVVFTGSGGQFTARAHFIGSAAPDPGSWLWGWNNVNGFPDELVARAGGIRAFGEQYGVPELTQAELPLDGDPRQTAERLAVVATLICDRLPAYTADVGGGTIAVFLLEHPAFAPVALTTPRLFSVLQATAAEGRVRDWPRAVRQYAAFRGLTVAEEPRALVLTGPTIDPVRLDIDEQSRLSRISGTATSAGVPAESPDTGPTLDLRRPGVGYAHLTTPESIETAVRAGQLEWFWIGSPRFGGPETDQNRLAGPIGVNVAREWIDQQIVDVLERGGAVSMGVDIQNDEGGSRVPRSMTYDLGEEAGVHTLYFW